MANKRQWIKEKRHKGNTIFGKTTFTANLSGKKLQTTVAEAFAAILLFYGFAGAAV